MLVCVLLAVFAGANAQWWPRPMMMAPRMHPLLAPPMHRMPIYDSTFMGKKIVIANPEDQCASGFKYEVPAVMRDVDRTKTIAEQGVRPIMSIVRPFLQPFLAPWWKKDDPIDIEPMDRDRLDEVDLDLDAAAIPEDDDRGLETLREEDLEMGGEGFTTTTAAADCVPDFNEYIRRPAPEAALPETAKPAPLPMTRWNPWGAWGGMMLNPFMGYPFRYNMGTIGLPVATAPAAPVLADALVHRSIVAPLTPLNPFWAPIPYIKKK